MYPLHGGTLPFFDWGGAKVCHLYGWVQLGKEQPFIFVKEGNALSSADLTMKCKSSGFLLSFFCYSLLVMWVHSFSRMLHCSRPRPLRAPRKFHSCQASHSPNITPSKDGGTTAGPQFQAKYAQLMNASRLSLAPMMDYTDRHFRHLVRLISSRTLLYTEMVAANALSHAQQHSLLERDLEQQSPGTESVPRNGSSDRYVFQNVAQGKVEPLEGASVLQLGGSNIEQMYEAGEHVIYMTEQGFCDYTAINLNCGCPSPRVAEKGCFGAALMEDPKLVADLTRALSDGCGGRLPITVKCRIGTDSDLPSFDPKSYSQINPEEEYKRLCHFIETVASNGIVTDFVIHARIAVLQKSFSPSDNRKVPPLKYDYVRRLVHDFPELTFTLNGGVESLSQAKEQFDECPNLNGVMVGRSWVSDPWSFALTDQILFGQSTAPKNRLELLKEFGKHADYEEKNGDPAYVTPWIVKAVMSLFTGEPNAKRFRIAVDQISRKAKKMRFQQPNSGDRVPISELLLAAAQDNLSDEVLLRTPEESFRRLLDAENKRKELGSSPGGRSKAVLEWQSGRKAFETAASA